MRKKNMNTETITGTNSEEIVKKPSGRSKKKRRGKKAIIFGVIALVICGGVVLVNMQSAKAASVNTITVGRGNVEQMVSVTGSVESTVSKTFYAETTGILEQVYVAQGDIVKVGDRLYEYDMTDLENSIRVSELSLESAKGTYNSSIQSDNVTKYRLNEANANIATLDTQIADWTAAVERVQKELTEREAYLVTHDETAALTMQYDSEVIRISKQLNKLQEQLAEFKSYKAQMQSQQLSTTDSVMSSGQASSLKANLELAELSAEQDRLLYEAALEDGYSDMNGIVTMINANSGAMVSKGSPVLVMDSIDDCVVTVNLTKYDLELVKPGQSAKITIRGTEYTGSVSKISSVATKNNSGTTVVPTQIKLDAPDENIIIGIDAQVEILIGTATDAMIIPGDVISYDSEGAFVMVARDGVIVKQHVVIGMEDTVNTQILSGLEIGDQIITDDTTYLTEGTTVTTNSSQE